MDKQTCRILSTESRRRGMHGKALGVAPARHPNPCLYKDLCVPSRRGLPFSSAGSSGRLKEPGARRAPSPSPSKMQTTSCTIKPRTGVEGSPATTKLVVHHQNQKPATAPTAPESRDRIGSPATWLHTSKATTSDKVKFSRRSGSPTIRTPSICSSQRTLPWRPCSSLEVQQVDLLPSLDLPLQALAGSSFNPHRRGAVREHVDDGEVKLVMKARPAARPALHFRLAPS